MEFMDGTWKKEINTWEELVGNNLLNQEAVIEGAVHSIRNMGDVAFIILRRREGLFQTVYENEMANVSIHELKEAMTIRVKGILHEEERALNSRKSVCYYDQQNACLLIRVTPSGIITSPVFSFGQRTSVFMLAEYKIPSTVL